jgi:hypothetical protein
MSDAWSEVVTYPDRASAEAILGLLLQDGVPGRISSDGAIPGLGLFYSVVVPEAFLHRARWLLSQATRELPDGPDEP